jgi:hypothetical protein
MFIATVHMSPDAVRRSGNELALNTHDASRSSERRRRWWVTAGYKHLTPSGVRSADVLLDLKQSSANLDKQ